MYDLATLQEMNKKAASKAARAKRVPLIIEKEDITRKAVWELPSIPNLGDYRPKGWKLIAEHFVDSSGFGTEGEPALTVEQFLAKLTPGHGYAIIGEGQFQVWVGEFIREVSK